VLSNTNALEIRDMHDLSVENMADEVQVGRVLGLESALLDQLRDAGAFKRSQNWNLFRRPGTLVREETLAVGKLIQQINQQRDQQGEKTVLRHIVHGDKMCGKSVLLLQAMSMAFMSKWVVIDIPDGEHTFYFFIPNPDPS
jgi:small subunit ribosomal protein S29